MIKELKRFPRPAQGSTDGGLPQRGVVYTSSELCSREGAEKLILSAAKHKSVSELSAFVTYGHEDGAYLSKAVSDTTDIERILDRMRNVAVEFFALYFTIAGTAASFVANFDAGDGQVVAYELYCVEAAIDPAAFMADAERTAIC